MIVILVVLVVLLVVLPIAGWALWILLSAALVGAIIGGLARLVLPGKQDIGVLSTIAIGWVGSLAGSLVGRHIFHWGSFLTVVLEIIVAAVLVAIAAGGVGNLAAKHDRRLRF
jgi:uncharacterized membrane protein YeaQ/YmgE (transglycosylase-associated protein family)